MFTGDINQWGDEVVLAWILSENIQWWTLVWFIFGFCLNHERECFTCYKTLVDSKLSYIEPFILLYSYLMGNWLATHYTLAMVTHVNSLIFTHWWSSRSSCVSFSTIFSFCNEILDLACFAAIKTFTFILKNVSILLGAAKWNPFFCSSMAKPSQIWFSSWDGHEWSFNYCKSKWILLIEC